MLTGSCRFDLHVHGLDVPGAEEGSTGSLSCWSTACASPGWGWATPEPDAPAAPGSPWGGHCGQAGGWCSQQLWLGTPPALPVRMQAHRRAAALHSPPGAHLAPGRLLPSSGAPRDRAQHRGCQAGRSLQLLWPGRQSPVSPAG